MTTLWDTTGTAVVKALAAERRSGGSVTSGIALTLVSIVDEKAAEVAESAAALAAAKHPLRLLMVIRRQIDAPVPRLDAEVTIGGRLGPGEAVVMRMYGRLALHAESVTLPLLAPDAPVVAWFQGEPPEKIAHDPLGVFADRRITDVAHSKDPVGGLKQRAQDFAPGDTDLAWARITRWRAALASAFDGVDQPAVKAVVHGDDGDPSALLLAGWLSSRFGFKVPVKNMAYDEIDRVEITLEDGAQVQAVRDGTRLVLKRQGQEDSIQPFPDRAIGDLLSEELKRLDDDFIYADALGAVFGIKGLRDRPSERVHIWKDPMLADANA